MSKKKKQDYDIAIALILDGSGSMAPIKADTIGGVNTFISKQKADLKADEARALFGITIFSTYANVLTLKDLNEVDNLTESSYPTFGGTALYDAIGSTIAALDQREDLPKKVMLVVLTDGEENSSVLYTREAMTALVNAKKNAGWAVLFLGVAMDAFNEAGKVGIVRQQTLSVPLHMAGNYMAASSASASMYRTGTISHNDTARAIDLSEVNLNASPTIVGVSGTPTTLTARGYPIGTHDDTTPQGI